MNWLDILLYIFGLLGLYNIDPFPEDMEVKYFSQFIDKETSYGSIHTLMCPIVDKDLEKELLCGLDAKYSTGNAILYSGFVMNYLPDGGSVNIFCIDLVVDNMMKNFDTRYVWHGKCFIDNLSPQRYYYIMI